MRPGTRRGLQRAAAVLALALLLALAYGVGRLAQPGDRPMVSLKEFRSGLRKAGIWEGGPNRFFKGVGRDTLGSAIRHGLMPEHRVLDIGAGSLRVAWWLFQYIEPSNYHAIEPVRERIDRAAQILGVADEIHIYYNTDFEFPSVTFDFVIARSIWTHASKPMIAKMLAEFDENAAPEGRFLTSVIFAATEEEDYQGYEWVGKVEKSDVAGKIAHSREWIEKECAKNRLSLEVVGELYGQTWLLIARPGQADGTPAAR